MLSKSECPNWLTQDGKEVTQVLLAEHLGMESMNISQALKILQREGYILRSEHSQDTRAKSVALSSKGFMTTQIASEKIAESDFFFSTLGNDLDHFKKSMTRLIML